jgi:hypothetical protein
LTDAWNCHLVQGVGVVVDGALLLALHQDKFFRGNATLIHRHGIIFAIPLLCHRKALVASSSLHCCHCCIIITGCHCCLFGVPIMGCHCCNHDHHWASSSLSINATEHCHHRALLLLSTVILKHHPSMVMMPLHHCSVSWAWITLLLA